ncbi:MAG: SMP-30/gluconolactonase/LRE family protein [Proteobacteria bacterium]|nr:SMP-30/gluconolactonase/LRE family protein [Pseudomonadota bacterium]
MPNVGTVSIGVHPMTVRGMRFLPDGDLVFADRAAGIVMRLNLTNLSKRPIASGFREPNGIVLDMDGFIYLTGANKKIVRIHPDTGATETMFTGQYTLDGITFSPDYKTIYFNTERGHVSKLPINDDGSAGKTTRLATIQGDGPADLDGLTTDECGNIYVVKMNGTVWRIGKEGGKPEKVVTIRNLNPAAAIISAVNFGSGIGGWKEDALYIIAMASNKVYEVEVGVRGIEQP